MGILQVLLVNFWVCNTQNQFWTIFKLLTLNSSWNGIFILFGSPFHNIWCILRPNLVIWQRKKYFCNFWPFLAIFGHFSLMSIIILPHLKIEHHLCQFEISSQQIFEPIFRKNQDNKIFIYWQKCPKMAIFSCWSFFYHMN